MNECICVDILYKLKLPMTSCFQSIFFPTQLSSFSNRHIFSMLRHQQNNQSSSAANLMKAYHAPALGVGCSSANHYQRTSTVSFSFPQLTSFPLPGSPPPLSRFLPVSHSGSISSFFVPPLSHPIGSFCSRPPLSTEFHPTTYHSQLAITTAGFVFRQQLPQIFDPPDKMIQNRPIDLLYIASKQ
jgi:hypothetical protein